MHEHPSLVNLLLHDDDELADILGIEVVQRENLNVWHLSSVQRLRLADGTSVAYKSQLPPTVEALFYERAASPLLPGYRVLEALGACQTMLIDWIEAPTLHDALDGDADLVAHGKEIVAAIGDIDGELPCYLDIGTPNAWSEETQLTLEKTSRLIAAGRFRSIDPDAVERVRQWTIDPRVVERVTRDARVVHSDLHSNQILVTSDGYVVLDWQRPVVTSPDLDLVSLLRSEHHDPRRFVDADVVRLFWMLLLHWTAAAQHDLLPNLDSSPFDKWAEGAVRGILS